MVFAGWMLEMKSMPNPDLFWLSIILILADPEEMVWVREAFIGGDKVKAAINLLLPMLVVWLSFF